MLKNIEEKKRKKIFFPVERHELKKVIPMMFMFYLILFNYTVLRDTKDTLVVTSAISGSEIIPFLKLWVNVPFAIIFTIIYSKASNFFTRERLFYSVIGIFLIFFLCFSFFIYPNRKILEPSTVVYFLYENLPSGFSGLVAVLHHWPSSLFYVMSELWGSVCLSLLFWGFANQINTISESKRFYALFGLMGNLALPSAGLFVYVASGVRENLPQGEDPWGVSLKNLTLTIFFSGLLIMMTYWWINKYVVSDVGLCVNSLKDKAKKKLSLSVKESFLYMVKSKYLLCIATLVICYGVCINIVEVTWKNHIRLQYPSPNEYNQFMGLFSTYTGLFTMFMMFFVTNNLLRRFGWTVAALTTPVALLVTAVLFFAFVLFYHQMPESFFLYLGVTPLFLVVILGAIQNILSKSSKYALFDPTKEMAYIPLDEEMKVKGKAAIDIIGNPTGKATGSIIQQALIIGMGSLAAITPYIAVIMLVFFVLWGIAGRSLGKQFSLLSKETSNEDN